MSLPSGSALASSPSPLRLVHSTAKTALASSFGYQVARVFHDVAMSKLRD
jgi:hypothetical protein